MAKNRKSAAAAPLNTRPKGVQLRATGEASATAANWDAYFALVHKLLELERQVGAFVATDQMQSAAAGAGALADLRRFMSIYQ
jgi:hypothetical protein